MLSALALVLVVPWGAGAASSLRASAGSGSSAGAYISASLVSGAQSNPDATFNVIVQGDGSASADRLAHKIGNWAAHASDKLQNASDKATSDAAHAQDQADQAAAKLAAAQADSAAKAAKALLTGKKSDQNAASKAAAVLLGAQQDAQSAQDALAQANAALADAQSALGQASDQIVRQDVADEFNSISGVAVTLTGRQLSKLIAHAGDSGVAAITPNVPAQSAGSMDLAPGNFFYSTQLWPYDSKSANLWPKDARSTFAAKMPSIAIVDSGIDSTRADFGNRVLASVNLSSLATAAGPGDGNGHGTFVAGIAADSLSGITGADPAANLVDVKVMDSNGMGMTSDIINACQWILDNASKYNIKVANFSLHSDITAPFYVDPLDRAVEQLWFNGITVVTAAGNYGNTDGTASGVIYSPGDDPFVITVGASDTSGSVNANKATMAPWSAYGYTPDGFFKPEVSAPGRYMIGPVPPSSTLPTQRPASVTSAGYMQLSGTSFAAPVVSGAVANMLAANPTWTPDQVKGALMLTAVAGPKLTSAAGVGVVQVVQAVGAYNPPNPNLALEQWVQAGSTTNGVTSYSFDGASWNSAVQSNASWNSASWNSASWNSASWNSASWNSVSWNSASWNSASWNSASWNSASWNSVAATSASREDAVVGDTTADPTLTDLTPASSDLSSLLADPTFDPTTLPPDVQTAVDPTAAPTTTASTSTAGTLP